MEENKRYPMPIPFGWYCVAQSKDLEPGDVKPVRYFGQDQVLFRTSTGEAVSYTHLRAHET